MKKFEISLEPYDIGEGEKRQPYPMRENLVNMLRAPQIFKTGEAIVEAVVLAKQIRDSEGDNITLDERELVVLREAFNQHLRLAEQGRTLFGGPIHEECILRVFGAKEATKAYAKEG